MIFAPQTSAVRKVYSRIPAWPRRCPITLAVWSPELQKLEGHTHLMRVVAFSYDGTLLASASDDKTVRLWNPHTGQEVQKLEDTESVSAVAFSHDGTLLASVLGDKTVRLWNPRTAQEVQKLEGHPRITTTGFSLGDTALLINQGRILISIDDKYIPYSNFKPSVGQSIIIKGTWIQQGDYNLLWLPQEYRSGVSAFYSNIIAIGLYSGQVRFIQLDNLGVS